MPLGDLEDEAMAKVLIVAQDQILIENIKRELPLERSFKAAVAASGFDAGIQAESFHPDCIIVDFSIGRTESLQICQNLRRNAEFADVILIALLPDDGSSTSFDRSAINETFKPFDAALLAERLRTLIGAKRVGLVRAFPPDGSTHTTDSPVQLTRRGRTPATDNLSPRPLPPASPRPSLIVSSLRIGPSGSSHSGHSRGT